MQVGRAFQCMIVLGKKAGFIVVCRGRDLLVYLGTIWGNNVLLNPYTKCNIWKFSVMKGEKRSLPEHCNMPFPGTDSVI